MTKSEIIKEVAEGTGLTKLEIEAVLEGIILSISESLKRGERVDLRGFGSFLVKHRAARDARNPATREIVKLQERFVPVFITANDFLPDLLTAPRGIVNTPLRIPVVTTILAVISGLKKEILFLSIFSITS